MLNPSHRVPGHIVRSNLQRESMLRCHPQSDHTLESAKPCSVPGQGLCVACTSKSRTPPDELTMQGVGELGTLAKLCEFNAPDGGRGFVRS